MVGISNHLHDYVSTRTVIETNTRFHTRLSVLPESPIPSDLEFIKFSKTGALSSNFLSFLSAHRLVDSVT